MNIYEIFSLFHAWKNLWEFFRKFFNWFFEKAIFRFILDEMMDLVMRWFYVFCEKRNSIIDVLCGNIGFRLSGFIWSMQICENFREFFFFHFIFSKIVDLLLDVKRRIQWYWKVWVYVRLDSGIYLIYACQDLCKLVNF